MPLVEIIAMYDETGKNVIEQYNYEFDGETRLAFVKQKNTWNEYGLPTESYFWHGKLIETGDGNRMNGSITLTSSMTHPMAWRKAAGVTVGTERSLYLLGLKPVRLISLCP